jgi:putative peptidoglycan lipid II flippase
VRNKQRLGGVKTLARPLLLSAVTGVGALADFARDSAIGYLFGIGSTSDVFFTALILPNLLASRFMSGCAGGIAPLLVGVRRSAGESEASRTCRVFFTIAVGCGTLAAALMYIFAPALVGVLGVGLGRMEYFATVHTMRKLVAIVVASAIVGIGSGALAARASFVTAALLRAMISGAVVMGLWAIHMSRSLHGLTVLTVSGWTIGAVAIAANMARARLLTDIRPAFPALEDIRSFAFNVGWPLVCILAMSIGALGEQVAASMLSAGTVSAINYAQRLTLGPSTIVTFGVTTILVPALSFHAESDEKRRRLDELTRYLALTSCPMTALLFFLAPDIVLLYLGHRKVSTSERATVVSLTRAYAVGVPFGVIATALRSMYWADRVYEKLFLQNFAFGAVDLALALVMARLAGATGVGVANSLAWLFSFVALYVAVRGKYGGVLLPDAKIYMMKVLLATGAMMIIVSLAHASVAAAGWPRLCACMAAGLAIYATSCILLGLNVRADAIHESLTLLSK